MAGAAGFEPANVDSKNRCLTAWRRPNKRKSYAIKVKFNEYQLFTFFYFLLFLTFIRYLSLLKIE